MEDWRDFFTERELKEIELAQVYVAVFNHGTDGHNAKTIIAKFVDLMEEAVRELATIRKEP